MSLSPRDYNGALAFARAQHNSGTAKWGGMCQAFVHDAYGIGALYGSAWAQWLACPAQDKHPGTDPSKAPLGAALCFKGGSKGYGHIMLAARPFRNGTPAAWSNDMVRYGHIDKCARTAPVTHWGQQYVGWISNVNGVDLRLPQNVHYGALSVAISNVKTALATARAQSDDTDAKVLTDELARLQNLYDSLRRHA